MTARARGHSGQGQLLLPIAGGLPATVDPPPPAEPDIEGLFAEFYRAYPRRKAPERARREFTSALKRATFDQLLGGAQRYAEECRRRGTEPRYVKHPATWLRGGCWLDEPDAPYSAATASFARIGAEFRAKAGHR